MSLSSRTYRYGTRFRSLAMLAVFLPAPIAAQSGREAIEFILPEVATYQTLVPHLKMLNEFESRRRLNTFFDNEQPLFRGAQVGFVNVGAGNLTFTRRDLVAVGRMPLLLARVYDSSLEIDGGFGKGWHLAAAESIVVEGHASASLQDESGVWAPFIRQGEQWVAERPAPTDITDFRQLDRQHFQLRLKSGLTKEFSRVQTLDTANSASSGRFVLSRVVDRNGNAARLSYSGGKLIRLQGSSGREVMISRDQSGRITTIRDDQGRSVDYRYDNRGLLNEVIDIGGNTWHYEYDPHARLIKVIDPIPLANLRARYDPQGRVIELKIPSARYEFAYSAGKTLVADAAGRRSEYHQNAEGITTMVRNALGIETRIELGVNNLVRRLWRGGVLQSELKYDRRGRLVALHQSDGEATKERTYSYNKAGLLARIAGDFELALEYDSRGNLTERRDAAGRTTYGYSKLGDLISLQRPALLTSTSVPGKRSAGPTYHFGFDRDGQITSVVGPRGKTALRYHSDGKLLAARFADGSAQTFDYDGLGMRLARHYDDGGEVEYEYSSVGNILDVRVTTADGLSGGQAQILDQDQRVTRVQDSTGREMTISYDQVGNVTMLRHRQGASLFRYDSLNRLSEVVTPEGRWLGYTYAKGEADLRVQADRKTRGIPAARISSGLTFAPSSEVLYSRTTRSDFGPVNLDSALAEYQLTTEAGPVLPNAVLLQALARTRLLDAKPSGAQNFAEPSNVLFVPPEYASLNCCIPLPWCSFCDPNPRGRCFVDPGGGGGGGGGSLPVDFPTCCAVECGKCQTAGTTARNNALILFIAAEGACQAAVCATNGQGSAQCIACQATALTLYLLRLQNADSTCGSCVGARTNICRAQVSGSSTLNCGACSC